MRSALAALLLMAPAASAGPPQGLAAQASWTCGRGPGFKYCLFEPVGERAEDVLYFLHGAGDTHKGWIRWPVAEEFFKLMRGKGLRPPAVAAVSFGKIHFISQEALGKTIPADVFISTVMPFIEARTGAPRRRLLWGLSMGGFNAVQLLTRRPDRWAGAVLSCPGLLDLPDDPKDSDLMDFRARTGADGRRLSYAVGLWNKYFPDPQGRARSSPWELAKRPGVPPILIEIGNRDEYGFLAGAGRLASELVAAGKDVELRVVEGEGHCVVSTPGVVDFLAGRLAQGVEDDAFLGEDRRRVRQHSGHQ